MLGTLRRLIPPPISSELREKLRRASRVSSAGFDTYGLHPETLERVLRWTRWIYRDYFRVEVEGIENVPAGRVMLVPNHGGQLPLDGMLVGLAMVLDADPPRFVRGMVERWFPSLPFVSTLFVRCGQVVGDPENCKNLLEREEAIMVFPEGVRGSGKTWWHRYELQEFGTGFVRLAIATGTPIVPVGVIGAEETYPAIYDAKWLARLLKIPYVPVTPFWPLLGPLGALPLPVPIAIKFGEPLRFEGDADAPDHEVAEKVDLVKARIDGLLQRGLDERPWLRSLDPVARWGR
ncbi:MAG: lysophospholipid acyltransferase family protein [Planctomycetota bacterium]